MKKFITLVLALVMVFALAAPAMAFTSDEYEETSGSPFELDIALVEYDEGYLSSHVLTLPASNRGYLKNEVVCAVVSVDMPKEKNPFGEDYTTLTFSGDGVSLNVGDNKVGSGGNANLFTNLGGRTIRFAYNQKDDTLKFTFEEKDAFANASENRAFTANIAFFAKVTAEDASLKAEMVKASAFTDLSAAEVLEYKDYVVEAEDKYAPVINKIGDFTVVYGRPAADKKYGEADNAFFVFNKDGELQFRIDVDGKNKTTGVFFGADGAEALNSTIDGLVFADKNVILKSGEDYRKLKKIYDDVFVDEFGFDLDAKGNVLKTGYFEENLKGDNLYAEVVIEPWYASIDVPSDNDIVTDPPKVGNALNGVGFLMVGLCALAVVAMKKVRA